MGCALFKLYGPAWRLRSRGRSYTHRLGLLRASVARPGSWEGRLRTKDRVRRDRPPGNPDQGEECLAAGIGEGCSWPVGAAVSLTGQTGQSEETHSQEA